MNAEKFFSFNFVTPQNIERNSENLGALKVKFRLKKAGT